MRNCSAVFSVLLLGGLMACTTSKPMDGTRSVANIETDAELIGITRIHDGFDFDAVETRNDRKLEMVKLCAQNDDLEIDRVEVEFGNHTRQVIPTRERIRRGNCTAWKDLNGGDRNVIRVFVWGSSRWDWTGRNTSLAIYGQYEPNWGFDNGFRIGSTRINNGRDFDSVPVNGRKIEEIKLCARGDDVRLDHVEVEFRNGSHQTIPTRDFVRRGDCTSWKKLKGDNARNVVRMGIWAQSDWDWHGQDTTIVIFAR